VGSEAGDDALLSCVGELQALEPCHMVDTAEANARDDGAHRLGESDTESLSRTGEHTTLEVGKWALRVALPTWPCEAEVDDCCREVVWKVVDHLGRVGGQLDAEQSTMVEDLALEAAPLALLEASHGYRYPRVQCSAEPGSAEPTGKVEDRPHHGHRLTVETFGAAEVVGADLGGTHASYIGTGSENVSSAPDLAPIAPVSAVKTPAVNRRYLGKREAWAACR